MIKSIDFPDKVFSTKAELYKELRINAEKIIAVKKAAIHKSEGFVSFLTKEASSEKALPVSMKADYVYPVINTTNYMDSHMDAHFDGIWNKSYKEQQGKIFYVLDHELKVSSVIAWPQDVNILVKTVPWSFVNKAYLGYTQALIYEIDKSKIVNDIARKAIEDKRPVQNSVRMAYVKVKLAMNSDEKEDAEFKSFYDSNIDKIANKEKVEELGYFWGVEEAKILSEGSMVLFGSNDATPIQEQVFNDDSTKIQPAPATDDQPHRDHTQHKSMVICSKCQTVFDTQSNSAKCPGCGQYVSSQSTRMETVDLIAAIRQIKFINI